MVHFQLDYGPGTFFRHIMKQAFSDLDSNIYIEGTRTIF